MTRVEELREKWFDGLKYEFSGMLHGMSDDLGSLLTKVHAEGVAEGAAAERERIRKEAVDEHWGSIGEDVRRLCTVPVSALDPSEGTTERRNLTWEEYDNLFRGTASEEPSALAPTKETKHD